MHDRAAALYAICVELDPNLVGADRTEVDARRHCQPPIAHDLDDLTDADAGPVPRESPRPAIEIAGKIADNAPLSVEGTKAQALEWEMADIDDSHRLSSHVEASATAFGQFLESL